jgi:alpha-galactosidase
MASTITVHRAGSGDAEQIALGNGRVTVSWGPGTELTLFEHAGIQTRIVGGPLIELMEGTRAQRPATVGMGRDTAEDLAADPQPFRDALGTGLRAHRTFPVAGWPLLAEMDIAVYQALPWVVLSLRISNVGASPVTVNRLFPFVAGPVWGEHPISLGGRESAFSVSKQGWQSWSFAGGLPPGHADPRHKLETGSLWHNPGGVAPRDPVGEPVDVVSDGMVLVGTTEGYPALLAGFLGSARHFGQLYVDRMRGSVTAAALLDTRVLSPGEHVESEPLVLGAGHPAQLLQAYADALAAWNGARPSVEAVTGWCSWYYYYTDITEADVMANVAALRAARALVPLEVVELDDGYQRAVGDWTRVNEKFPSGMAAMAQRIREAGFRPGLWIAPFTVASNSQLAEEHPEWLVQNNGEPVFAGTNWQTVLHGLDTSHPGAREWLRRLFSTLVEVWGFDYLKLDFLVTAAVRGQRYHASTTGAEALRRGLELIRSVVGENVFLLGCGCPLLSAVGIVDAMRIGTDVATRWLAVGGINPPASGDAFTAPKSESAVRNTVLRAWMHPTLWSNDPDCLLARDVETELTADEVRALATAVGLSGGTIMISDPVQRLTLERLRMIACLLPPLRERALPSSYFEPGIPGQVVARIERSWGSWCLVGLFNQESSPQQVRIAWHQLGLVDGSYHATEFWSGNYLGCSEQGAALTIGPHGAAVLAVRASQSQPFLLSSTFHISQGAVEVSSWDYEYESNRVRWTARLGRDAAGTFMLWVPPDLTPRRLVSTARNAHWRRHDGSSSVIIVETEIADHADFALELERTL